MSYVFFTGCWLGFFYLLGLSSPPLPTAEQVAQRLQIKYNQIRSFSAQFRQVFRGRGVKIEETGIVMMKKPGKMYWEYRNPIQKLFVSDANKTYFYVPREKQVMISDLEDEAGETPLLFLLGRGDLQADFQVTFEDQEQPLQPENYLLRLTPKEARGDLSYLILEVLASTFQIYRFSLIEPIGNRQDFILTDFRENIHIADRQFKLELPPDVEIITYPQ